MDFKIPDSLAALEEAAEPGFLAVREKVDVAEMEPREAMALVESVAFDLCENDALCILQQNIFDQVYSLVSAFASLAPAARSRAVDALASNLSVLNASTMALLLAPAARGAPAPGSALRDHRAALKAYVTLLSAVAAAMEAEARVGAGAPTAAAPAAKGKGKAAPPSSAWSWDDARDVVLRAMAGCAELDLTSLHGGRPPDDALLRLLGSTAVAALAAPAVAKTRTAVREASARILGPLSSRYSQAETLAASIAHALSKGEHAAAAAAEAIAMATAAGDGGAALAGAVLREIGRVNPREYASQQRADAAGLRAVAAFLVDLADRAPAAVASSLACLAPHLDGEAYSLRCALVSVYGRLVASPVAGVDAESGTEPAAGGATAGGARARRKQALLDALLERGRDVNAFVRARVLQAWAGLAETRSIPIGHYVAVTDLAVGRLEDKAAAVRRPAIRLLASLLTYNPFGGRLPLASFRHSLEEFAPMLAQAEAAAVAAEGGMPPTVEVEVEVTPESTGDVAETVAPAVVPPAEQSSQEDPATQAPPALPPPIVGGATEQMRGVVASLTSAIAFITAIGAALPILSGLLASPTAADATEAVSAIVLAHEFGVDGAPTAARKMLPLAFAREAAVREAALDAVRCLYVCPPAAAALPSAAQAAAAARRLSSLVVGANLGELASLESLIASLVTSELLPGAVVRALWALATDPSAATAAAADADDDGVTTPAAAARGALAVLTLAAAAKPSIVSSNLDYLLAAGFEPSARGDACLARYACAALQKAAPPAGAPASRRPFGPGHGVFTKLAGLVADPPPPMGTGLPDCGWFSAADAALGALYGLHPAPEAFCGALLRRMASAAFPPDVLQHFGGGQTNEAAETAVGTAAETDPGDGDGEGTPVVKPEPGMAAAAPAAAPPPVIIVSASAAARFLFALGHVSLQQLVYSEALAGAVRTARNARDRAASETAAAVPAAPAVVAKPKGRKTKKAAVGMDDDGDGPTAAAALALAPDDLTDALGGGSAAEDAALDALRDKAEREIVGPGPAALVGAFAPLVRRVCAGLASPSYAWPADEAPLRAAAVLALCKLMAVDAPFCDSCLQLLFTLLARSPEPALRSTCAVALGDLAFRWPNLVEPWTEHLYARLRDVAAGVRKNALMVLSHLILNDMLKVKGYVAEMALCLEDDDPRIADLAKLFFAELARKGGASVLYALLPDIVSRLSSYAPLAAAAASSALGGGGGGPTCDCAQLPPAGFGRVMRYLLSFMDKDKQAEGLMDKLAGRFATAGGPQQRRDVATCMALLPLTEKGLKKLSDDKTFKGMAEALLDAEVLAHMLQLTARSRKLAKPEFKAALDDFDKRLRAAGEGPADGAEAGGGEDAAAAGDGGDENAAEATAGNAKPAAAPRGARGKARPADAGAAKAPRKKAAAKAAPKKKKAVVDDDDDDDDAPVDDEDDEEEVVPKARAPRAAGRRPLRDVKTEAS